MSETTADRTTIATALHEDNGILMLGGLAIVIILLAATIFFWSVPAGLVAMALLTLCAIVIALLEIHLRRDL